MRAEETPALPKPIANAGAEAVVPVSNEVDAPPAPLPDEPAPPSVKNKISEAPERGPSNATPLPGPSRGAAASAPEVVPRPAGVPTQPQSGAATRLQPLPPSADVPRLAQPDSAVSAKPSASPEGAALIDIHAKDLAVRAMLEMLSRAAKVNILVSKDVAGELTLELHDKTLDDVLDAIVKLCHVTVQRNNGVIYVTTIAELQQAEEENLPMRVYHLNYVNATDVEKMIKPLLSQGKGVLTTSPKSETGVAADGSKAGGDSMAGGDIIIVKDYEQELKAVDRLIAEIDVQPIQVLIEAVIVQVTLDKDMELGVNYAVLDSGRKTLATFGNAAAVNAATGFTPASVVTAAGAMTNGFADGTNGVKFGWVGGPTSGFISALETFGETKVLASPRILVLNKQHAEIQLGDKLGYQTITQFQTSTTQTVQFLDVGTLFRFRPFVTSDGVIRMEIHPEKSSGEINLQGVPQQHTAEVTTDVMIPDGATLAIGGLIDNEIDKKWEGLPYLSRIPVIGDAFRHTIVTTAKKELIVIITPHILPAACPERINYLGRPRTLGLDQRVSQTPCEEKRDGPSLFELARPDSCPPVVPLSSGRDATLQRR
jgi:type IV pilus secretin PilQ/predicted competence protein